MEKSKNTLVGRLLKRNLSKTQLIGFTLSNFIGLAIVISGLQFFSDVRSIWESEDSFIKRDYLVVNKVVTSSNTMGQKSTEFTEAEIADIQNQPWVRRIGKFSNIDYNVMSTMSRGDKHLSTYMFFEAIPSDFIDVDSKSWKFSPGDAEVPLIISKDYLTLYNFGFASSAGLPQVSEQMLSSVPMDIRISNFDGSKKHELKGRVVGFSNRLNTILVPQEFMDWSNREFGENRKEFSPSRLIIDVSSPGDVAIDKYLKEHDLELAGDKKNSQASYFLNLIAGVMVSVGILITVLSFFILMLSVALLLQKNREKLHSLIMLGFNLSTVSKPYEKITALVSVISFALAVGVMFIFRSMYIEGIAGLSDDTTPNLWLSLSVGLGLTILTVIFNIIAIRRKVRGAFYK